MSDLSRLIDDLCAGLDAEGSAPVPTLPTSGRAGGNCQNIEIAESSHISHPSHAENEQLRENAQTARNSAKDWADKSRVTSYQVDAMGNVGSVGDEEKYLVKSTPLLFPQSSENVGSAGREAPACETYSHNLNRVALPRSDWWTGPAMAEADRLVPPTGNPLPFSPADVHAGLARELRALAALGVTGHEAERRAVEITRAKIRNSAALAERQANGGRCHQCGEPLDDTRPVVAVLQAKGGGHLWLHGDECHEAYSRRRAVLVDRIMAEAGYGAEVEGEAA